MLEKRQNSVTADPVLAFVEKFAWFLNEQSANVHLSNADTLAEKARTTRKTIYEYRGNIYRMLSGTPLPLPPWSGVLALAWAVHPEPITADFLYHLQELERLYEKALIERPREYGNTGSMRAITKADLQPPVVMPATTARTSQRTGKLRKTVLR